MKILKSTFRAGVLCTLLVAVGCGSSPAAPSPTPRNDDGGGTPTASRLTVTNVEVLIAESYPVRVVLRVDGEVPNACTEIDQVAQARSGNQITVTITTKRTAEVCAQVIRSILRDVLREGPFEAGAYVVRVNGVERRFTV